MSETTPTQRLTWRDVLNPRSKLAPYFVRKPYQRQVRAICMRASHAIAPGSDERLKYKAHEEIYYLLDGWCWYAQIGFASWADFNGGLWLSGEQVVRYVLAELRFPLPRRRCWRHVDETHDALRELICANQRPTDQECRVKMLSDICSYQFASPVAPYYVHLSHQSLVADKCRPSAFRTVDFLPERDGWGHPVRARTYELLDGWCRDFRWFHRALPKPLRGVWLSGTRVLRWVHYELGVPQPPRFESEATVPTHAELHAEVQAGRALAVLAGQR